MKGSKSIATPTNRVTHSATGSVRPHTSAPDVRDGWAYEIVLSLTNEPAKAVAAALDLHPSNVSRRKSGDPSSPLARMKEEIRLLAAHGLSAMPLVADVLASFRQSSLADRTTKELIERRTELYRLEAKVAGQVAEERTRLLTGAETDPTRIRRLLLQQISHTVELLATHDEIESRNRRLAA